MTLANAAPGSSAETSVGAAAGAGGFRAGSGRPAGTAVLARLMHAAAWGVTSAATGAAASAGPAALMA